MIDVPKNLTTGFYLNTLQIVDFLECMEKEYKLWASNTECVDKSVDSFFWEKQRKQAIEYKNKYGSYPTFAGIKEPKWE